VASDPLKELLDIAGACSGVFYTTDVLSTPNQ